MRQIMLISKIRVYRSDGSDHVASQLPYIVFLACTELHRKGEETVLIGNFLTAARLFSPWVALDK